MRLLPADPDAAAPPVPPLTAGRFMAELKDNPIKATRRPQPPTPPRHHGTTAPRHHGTTAPRHHGTSEY
ncbi:hypothetical protein ACWD1Y_32245 [Streptomyces sp. NPDC002814]